MESEAVVVVAAVAVGDHWRHNPPFDLAIDSPVAIYSKKNKKKHKHFELN